MTTADQFTAWCQCPRCDFVDCHPMRNPRRDAPVVVDDTVTHVVAFGGQVTKTIGPKLSHRDERGFDVFRQCRNCSHEWGQR